MKRNFVARWQDKHFKTCVKSFPIDYIVSIMDFVENYNFQVQNEVQSIHWHSYYIIILVHITYQFNLDFDGYDKTLGF